MIIMILLSHPDLISDTIETLADLNFVAKELAPLRNAMIDIAQEEFGAGAGLRAELREAGFVATLDRVDRTGAGLAWYTRPEASSIDAAHVLGQALALQHMTRSLPEELRRAELAFSMDMSEANWARMRDIQEQRNARIGQEAAPDSFGASSGRASPVV